MVCVFLKDLTHWWSHCWHGWASGVKGSCVSKLCSLLLHAAHDEPCDGRMLLPGTWTSEGPVCVWWGCSSVHFCPPWLLLTVSTALMSKVWVTARDMSPITLIYSKNSASNSSCKTTWDKQEKKNKKNTNLTDHISNLISFVNYIIYSCSTCGILFFISLVHYFTYYPFSSSVVFQASWFSPPGCEGWADTYTAMLRSVLKLYWNCRRWRTRRGESKTLCENITNLHYFNINTEAMQHNIQRWKRYHKAPKYQ